MTLTLTQLIVIATALVTVAYLIGRYQVQVINLIATAWDVTVDALTYDLPDTRQVSRTIGLDNGTSDGVDLPDWATDGEYLVRDNGTWRNVSITAHARYLMGEHADHVIRLVASTAVDSRGTERTCRVSGLCVSAGVC